jgi:hypothetical protein
MHGGRRPLDPAQELRPWTRNMQSPSRKPFLNAAQAGEPAPETCHREQRLRPDP